MKSNSVALVLAVVLSAVPRASEARDWFVRAGSDGDGSQARPFGDPWQALDKCEAGDAIHVTGGKYFGRSNTGSWIVNGNRKRTTLAPDGELYIEDFATELRRSFPRVAIAEAENMGWTYLGTDCLLLLLARIGVSGVDLPYDRIREVLRELNGPG